MPDIVKVTCPLGHTFQVDLDKHTRDRMIVKSTTTYIDAVYHFQCPVCGENFTKKRRVKKPAED